MDQPSLDSLLEALFPPPPGDGSPAPEVHAVLDGARDERIYRAVYDSRLEHECLLTGNIPYDLAEAAPYLVHLRREAPFTRWALEQGWGKGFGVFAWSRADLETLRRHFRRLLRVKDEQGRKLYFRYYDPRVLRVYLPTCTAEELREVFGPVGRLLLEGPGGRVLSYAPGGRPLDARGRPEGARGLVLRGPQIAALNPALGDEFQEHLLEHLTADYPVQMEELGEPGARAFVRRALEKGLAHRIEDRSSLATLAALMAEFGERFEISPAQAMAEQILEHPRLPGRVKVQVIEEQLRASTGGRKIVPARRATRA